jgi:transposase
MLPAEIVTRAKLLLTVAEGTEFQKAAETHGRKSGDAVAHLVARFNREGLAALQPRHGGGPAILYNEPEQQRILQEFQRTPTPELDGTATWSLTTLQKALRQAPDGLSNVSTYVIWQVLHQAGYTYQQSRSWCSTGEVQRKRKSGVVTVTDPDADAKKTD